MVICQYFLKGTCKFGDRCFNEHRRPENRGYNQGSRNQRNYQQDTRNFNSGGRYGNNSGNNSGRNSGGGRYNQNTGYDSRNYDGYNQGYRNQKNYHDNRGGGYYDGGSDGYSGRSGGGRDGYSGRSGGGRDGYSGHSGGGRDSYGGRSGGGRDGYSGHGGGGGDGYSGHSGGGHQNYSRDKYHYDARDKNRFSALSHQPDPELPSFNRSQQFRGRTHSTTSQQSATMDQKVDRVRKDMSEWHESGQWPLSCYAAFANEPCFDGLVDLSPEELRSEAYKANNSGNADKYKQSLQQTMEKYRRRKQELATMSSSELQDEISRSSQPSSTVPGGLFGNLASSPQSLGGTSLFGESIESMATSSTGFLEPSPQSMHTSGPFTSSNPTTTPSTFFGSSSAFGSTKVNNTPSSTSMFSEDNSSNVQTSTDGARSSTTTLRCSEDDLKAFRAAYFELGAIPECPPPLELC